MTVEEQLEQFRQELEELRLFAAESWSNLAICSHIRNLQRRFDELAASLK